MLVGSALRIQRSFSLLLACAVFCVLSYPARPTKGSPSILVNIGNCNITAKYVMNDADRCDIFKNERATRRCTFVQTAATLIIPPRSDSLPKVLVLQTFGTSYRFTMVDIPVPSHNNSLVSAELSGFYIMEKNNMDNNPLTGLLYDQMSRHLYVFSASKNNHRRPICDVFLLNFGEQRPSLDYLYNIQPPRTFYDVKRWSSNPYRQMFYYQKEEKVDYETMTALYAIPFHSLVASLKNGDIGAPVSRIAVSDVSVQVIDDAAHVITTDGTPVFLTLADKESSVATCPNVHVSANSSLLIVSGWEYCKLRDGASADPTVCEQMIAQANNWQVRWFHILAVVLVLFAVALLLVIICVRCKIIGTPGIRHKYTFSGFQREDDEELMDNTL